MKQKKKTEWSNLSREELLMLCIGDIIQVTFRISLLLISPSTLTIMLTQELLVADKEGKDVNLNKTKTRLVLGTLCRPSLLTILQYETGTRGAQCTQLICHVQLICLQHQCNSRVLC